MRHVEAVLFIGATGYDNDCPRGDGSVTSEGMMQERLEEFPHSEADGWQLFRTVAPRRSVKGAFVFGLVWRQRRDGRWIYMQANKRAKAAVELVGASQRSRRSRRLRRS